MVSVVLSVFIGGGVGATTRFLITKLATSFLKHQMWGTLLVNVLGSFFLLLFANKFKIENKELDAALRIGFLGALTTFSAMSFEVFQLVQEQRVGMAIGHVSLNILFGIIVVMMIFR